MHVEILNYTQLRNNLKEVLDRVSDDVDSTVVVRRDGDDAVIMSKSHYDSIMETFYLIKSPANAKRLMESVAGVNRGEFEERSLIDPDA